MKRDSPKKTGTQNGLCLVWVYVPKQWAEEVKTAAFAAGAGRIGAYSACSWETEGNGQFYPMPGSTPFLGSVGTLETTPELRIEFVCPRHDVKMVLQSIVNAHPYEEPAYGAVPFFTLADFRGGRG